ncbi:MAG TPA: chemotaxis protein CheB [Flavisolibacter sp.]|nr:chemotaxis protein CheB [Flavisolibacter sp.]
MRGTAIAAVTRNEMEVNEPRLVVVVGASAGGLNSVIELAAQLTNEMDLSLFVVLHLSKMSMEEVLIQRIQRSTVFTCKIAENKEAVRTRHLYLALADKHLVLKHGELILGEGPAENRWRPSIDVLFRSAAVAYDGRTIGIILTGLLQDGTSGMIAIKRSGGTCIVQDPQEAEYPDMPQSVLLNMDVDYCISLSQMGAILLEKSQNGVHEHHRIPEDVKAEAQIAERVAVGIDNIKDLGNRSYYSCPDCGGGLWEMVNDNIVRYRCFTGHVFTENELLLRQSETLENTLWVALRMIEERKQLLHKMALEEERKGWMLSAEGKKERAAELQEHISRLKDILFEAKNKNEPG